ncbi:MAG TPA: Si-specific NAD(P)(+) transhydrogenase [Planctomycetaceae bacterium]|jgi:NAD(P) transhydrogenase
MGETRFEFDLVCIGSGPAGQRAAIQASKLGKRVAVIEKQRCLGGVCIETGTIPSKTFREAVRRYYSGPGLEAASHFHTQGRPTMDQLVGHVGRVIEREIQMVGDALTRNDIEMIQGRATIVDPHTLRVESLEGKRTLTSEFIFIAVGTIPSDPPNVPADSHTVITSDSILSLEKLPRSIAVVGAGVVGIEYASMFAALDVQVTVIDKRPRPLEFLDAEIVDELMHQMRKHDVTFRCGETVSRIDVVESPQRKALVSLDSGKHVAADVILFSAGRVGATATLGLPEIGIEPDNRGRLAVDDRYRTVVPSVYAGGDVIGYPALAATSSEQGRIAACHMFGAAAEPMGSHFPVGIYAIPEISMVGATEQELTEKKVPYETGVARYSEISRGQILGDHSGMFKMIFHRDTRQLLGCHCIGSGATELIHIGQAVLGLEGGLDYFLTTVFNYPTLAECYKVAAFNAANKLTLEHSVEESAASAAKANGTQRL